MKNITNGFDFDRYTSIGSILLRAGALTKKQLERALRVQKEVGKPLGQILVEMGFCTQSAVDDAVEHQSKVRCPPSKSDSALQALWAAADSAEEASRKLHKKTTQTICVIDLNNGTT